MRYRLSILIVLCLTMTLSGCFGFRTSKKMEHEHQQMIDNLTQEIEHLNTELMDVQEFKDRKIAALKQTQENLLKKLKQEIGDREAKVSMHKRGLVINFLAQVFFDAGKVTIKKKGKASLDKVIQVLKQSDNEIVIEGHTDNQPIKNTKHLYRSNWDLSVSRSVSVLHYFVDQGIDPSRLAAAGYGEYQPIASNETESGRAQNRRVEILIRPSVSQVKKVAPATDANPMK